MNIITGIVVFALIAILIVALKILHDIHKKIWQPTAQWLNLESQKRETEIEIERGATANAAIQTDNDEIAMLNNRIALEQAKRISAQERVETEKIVSAQLDAEIENMRKHDKLQSIIRMDKMKKTGLIIIIGSAILLSIIIIVSLYQEFFSRIGG